MNLTKSFKSAQFATLWAFLGLAAIPLPANALTIYGSVIFSSDNTVYPPGIYEFDTTGPQSLIPVAGGENIMSQGGGAYANGRYYSIYVDKSTYNVYDTDTWALVQSLPMSNAALDMTYDPSDGNIYGCFNNSGIPELGILDTSTGKNSSIGTFRIPPVALMSDASGRLFSIGMDGTLYSVNKSNASITAIGQTGVQPYTTQSAIIDTKSGKCYWAASKDDLTSGLYEVNLTNGQATLLYDFPSDQEITGLFILPEIPALAPGKVVGLTANFNGAASTGTVTFTMPSSTASGSALTGELTWEMTFNDSQTITKTATAGEAVTQPVTLQPGEYKISVTVSNTEGEGAKTTITHFIGNDTPMPVTGLLLEKTTANELKLTWTKPSGGIHNGYVDANALRYKVVRYPGNTVVAASTHETAITDNIEATRLSAYYYVVTAEANGIASEEVSSNRITMGPAKEIPYSEDFSSTIQFNNLMITDANADGQTWHQNLASECAEYPGQGKIDADDWIVTPPLALDGQSNYRLKFDVCSYSADPHRIEARLGNLPNIKDLTTEVLPATEITNPWNWTTITMNFHVDNQGDYYIGLHMTSMPNTGSLSLDNLSVERIGSSLAPDAPTKLSAVAYDKGATGATISLTAPETAINGSALSTPVEVKLYRNDVLIKTFNNVTAGQTLTYEDNDGQEGTNTYSATAENDYGIGETASVVVYLGIDKPSAVKNISVEETENGHVTISWDAPTEGVNGGYIDPSELTYTVKRNGWKEISTGTRVLYAEDLVEEALNSQALVEYFVTATSKAGNGDEAKSPAIVVGKPYETPFKESFANAIAKYYPWNTLPLGLRSSWYPDGDYKFTSQDGDNGIVAVSCYSDHPEEIRLVSPKVRIGNTVNPELEFYIAHSDIADNLDVEVIADGQYTEVVKTIPLNSTGKLSWNRVTVSLKPYTGYKAIQLALATRNVGEKDQLYVDNISITDNLDNNLAAGKLELPLRMTAGRPAKVKATVTNVGHNNAESYTVNLYSGEELLASSEEPLLASGASSTTELSFVPSAAHESGMPIHFEVEFEKDQNPANNKSDEILAPIDIEELPVVDFLSGTTKDNTIVLSWDEPDTSDSYLETTTDDFESYASFTTSEIGDWTPVEGDPTYANGMEFTNSNGEWIIFPNGIGYLNTAFTVVDLSEIPNAKQSDGWSSVSGNKFLLTAYASSGGSSQMPYTGDYLVSPRLHGSEQTITINAKSLNYNNWGLETIEILASSTDSQISSFTLVESVTDVPTEWTRYRFTLPEGTLYFAIHSKTTVTALFLDDISYTSQNAKELNYEVTGYNVYRDNKRLNKELLTERRFTDTTAESDKDYRYSVSAVYDEGESALSTPVTINMSGISEIVENNPFRIVTTKGSIIVENCARLNISLYSADGKAIRNTIGEDTTILPVHSGFYILAINGRSFKVAVP